MRSDATYSLDLIVPVNYALIALALAERGEYGRMVVLKDGRYTDAPIGITQQGIKCMDVDELYDVDEYVPKARQVEGKPMFVY
jgi:6-phosphofructokinase 1